MTLRITGPFRLSKPSNAKLFLTATEVFVALLIESGGLLLLEDGSPLLLEV